VSRPIPAPDTNERLDEIASQVRNVAGVVQKSLELLQTGELDLARANNIRESAETTLGPGPST
jgi:hypothetical protein